MTGPGVFSSVSSVAAVFTLVSWTDWCTPEPYLISG